MVNGLSGNHEEPLNTSLIGNNPYNSSIEKISTAHVIKMIKKKNYLRKHSKFATNF